MDKQSAKVSELDEGLNQMKSSETTDGDSGLSSAPALYDWQTGEFKHEIHMSHVNNYLRCPKQFAAKYINNERKPANSIPLSTGRVHHSLLQEQVKRKLQKAVELSDDEIKDYVSDQIEEQAEYLEDGKETEIREMKDEIIQQSVVLQHQYIDDLEPRRTEQKFRISIPESPYDLVGTIDLERILNPDEAVLQNKNFGVDDLKTSSSSPPKHDKGGYKPRSNAHFLQQTAYSFGAWIANGGKPADYKQTLNRTVYLVKNKTPVVRPAVFVVTRNDILFLYNVLRDMVEGLKAGHFIANANGWWCDPERCPIFQKCRSHEVMTLEQVKQAKQKDW